MSNDMPSWRSLANAASRSIKGYVAQRDLKRPFPANRDMQIDGSNKSSWGQWAGQKLRTIGQGDTNGITATEKLSLFPGWACRRYAPSQEDILQDPIPFNIEISVSGFATRSSGQGFGSRAGKAFLRLAKSYAALPKLAAVAPAEVDTAYPQGRSEFAYTEDLLDLHLPPKPEDMTDEAEMELLNEQLRRLEMDSASTATESSASSQRSVSPTGPADATSSSSSNQLKRMHSNLEARLHPFWATALGSRSVRVSVYATDPTQFYSYRSPMLHEDPYDDDTLMKQQPIAMREVDTAADGSFQARLILTWEKMCVHPGALQIAFGDPDTEHELYVVADLMPGPLSSLAPPSAQVNYAVRAPRIQRSVQPTDSKMLVVPLTHSPVRLISDIDDTVKMSGILTGARAAFHNVFVKDLGDSIIPGMGEWYVSMWRRGVRFHYVSNSPFELLPVINEFIQLSKLPPGSVKLKSYAGRSLFNGLMTAPAERKRVSMLEILNSFSDAQFFLVGDSGEQDLELYTSLARERPKQILGIFVRDASNYAAVKSLEDPIGRNIAQPPPVSQRETQSSPGGSSSLPSAPSLPPRRPTARSVPSLLPSQFPNNNANNGEQPPPLPRRKGSRATSAYSPPPIREEPGYFTSHMLIDAPISGEPESLSMPVGLNYPPSGFARSRASSKSTSTSPGMEEDLFSSSSRSSSGASSLKVTTPSTETERKQHELQMRVYRARMEIPQHIPLRVFRDPKECVEAQAILDQLNMGRNQL